VLAFTRAFIALRRRSEALRLGDIRLLDAPGDVLAFERTLGGERLLCVFNLGAAAASLPVAGSNVRFALGQATIAQGVASFAGYSALFVEI
jgi:glycosidase